MARLHRILIVTALASAALFLGPARPSHAGIRVSSCGGSGQNACTLTQAVPSCDPFLAESIESCGFLCFESICRETDCGHENQPGCTPFVGHPWPDVCTSGNFHHAAFCHAYDADGYPEWCGDHEEEACSVDIQLFLDIASCKPGHIEEFGLPIGTCHRTEEPVTCEPGMDAVRCHLEEMSLALAAASPGDVSEKLRRKLEKRIARAHGRLAEAKARASVAPEKALRKLRGVERELEKVALLVEKGLAAPEPGIEPTLAALLIGEAAAALGEVEVARAALEPVILLAE